MKKAIFVFCIVFVSFGYSNDNVISDIDKTWDKMKISISSGDFRSFKTYYHRDAVFVNGISNKSYPIKNAFVTWKQGFLDTKKGLIDANLELKFSRRIFDSSTAHEVGIFHYYTIDKDGKQTDAYVHFESLWIKKHSRWVMMMENQISRTNKEEWDSI
tara:strand:+ start:38 stop:511 length:474 start_codon:yes stop_codon:yes gene_type:complete